tara:strand:- start:126 stop:296 length:171 start_codon:yes stop_codon:yes gene_type:complete
VGSKLAGSAQLFIEDTSKIFFLLVLMIYVIALIRGSPNIERVRIIWQKITHSLATL